MLNQRFFDLPDADAERVERRQATLPSSVRQLIQRANDGLIQNRLDLARGAVSAAMAQAPTHPDVLRMTALVHAQTGDLESARHYFGLALQQDAGDALLYRQYAEAIEESGAIEEAYELRKTAVARVPESALVYFDLGEHCFRHGSMDAAVEALEKSTQLAPGYVPAVLKLGSALVYAGRIDEGAAAYREALATYPDFGAAWFSLANIKTLRFTRAEVLKMRQTLQDAGLHDPDRLLIELALAKACEDDGRYQEAFSLVTSANRRKRKQIQWSSARFSEQVRCAESAFALPHTRVEQPDFGKEVIFIVGLPRSGTTLAEQIIASHSQVEGANELGDLGRIIAEESARLRVPYPGWVTKATAEDWRRLGDRYLELTARWRRRRPRFTDKMPSNWLFIGSIRAMLPGARIIACRRDPLENCWSCYKQYFFSGWDFTFSLDDIAAYWRDFNQSITEWTQREPEHIREQNYEALLEDPGTETRNLLAFCNLSFEDACMEFYRSSRSVRTASAGQVRQPLQKNTAKAAYYGELLDPLRLALNLTPKGRAQDLDVKSWQ
jgi:tetratricopeptide (TPR) repeat protein